MIWTWLFPIAIAAFFLGKHFGYRQGAEHGIEMGAFTYESKLEDVFGDTWAADLADARAVRVQTSRIEAAQWN